MSRYDDSTRMYNSSSGQLLTTSGSSSRSTAILADEVMLHASAKLWFRVGDNNVTASATATSIPLEAGEKFHIRILSGQFVAAIQDSEAGTLSIVPVQL
jgi:hypothetical protein